MIPAPSAAPTAADFGNRFSAFVIDGALLFGIQWVVFIVLSRQLQAVGLTSTEPCDADGVSPLCQGPSTALWVILLLLLLGSTVAYYAVFDGVHGATPGKRWMGLRVVNNHGAAPIGPIAGLLRSLVRQAFWLSLFFILEPSPLAIQLPSALFVLVPVVALAPVVWAAFSPDGRGLHDLAAQTIVVDVTRAVPAPRVADHPTFDPKIAEETL